MWNSKFFSKLSVLFLIVTISTSSVASTSFIQPTYYWSLDNLIGVTTQGNPQSISNDCIKGNCVGLDGNSCIIEGQGPTSSTNIQNKVTYAFWMKTGSDVNRLQYVLTQDMNYVVPGTLIREARGVYVHNGIVGIFTRHCNYTWEGIDFMSVSANSWYVISLVQNGSSLTGDVYGQHQLWSSWFVGGLIIYTNSWGLGCLTFDSTYDFSGSLDEISILNRPLNSSVINSLYTGNISISFTNIQNNSPQATSGNTYYFAIFDFVMVTLIIGIIAFTLISKRRNIRNYRNQTVNPITNNSNDKL